MGTLNVRDRAHYVGRAEQAMAWLETNPATTRRQLGAARDHLNVARNQHSPEQVMAAVEAMERLIATISRTGKNRGQ